MPSNVPSNWPPEKVDHLKSLWSEGKSAAEIALALGTGLSRNSVIGKVRRLKLENRPHSNQYGVTAHKAKAKLPKKPARKASKQVTLPPLPINRPEIIADAKPLKPSAYVALPGTTPIRLDQLGSEPRAGHTTTCRWPIGENPTLFCGCATEKTYCPAHAAMAYRPIEKAKK